jgi:hypothetical protein
VHRSECRFVRAVSILQRNEHRQDDEERVLDQPSLRLLTEDEILERRGGKRSEAAVDAGGICLHDAAVGRRQQFHRAFGFGPETVDANLAVESDGATSDECRQLARRATSRKIHLKEPILGVQKAEARATSSRVAPRMDGMPRWSRWMDTGAVNPATWREPSSCGKLPRTGHAPRGRPQLR